MSSDGTFFEVKRNPYVYACYILTFVSELALDSAHEEAEKNKSLSENYPNRLHFLRDRKTKELLELFTEGFLKLYCGIRKKREIFSNVNEGLYDPTAHEKFLKVIAMLEFYGYYLRCPWDIKIGERNSAMDLQGLSPHTKKVIRNVIFTKSVDGVVDGPFVRYGRYDPEKRCFE